MGLHSRLQQKGGRPSPLAAVPNPSKNTFRPSDGRPAGFLAKTTERKPVGGYICPACGEGNTLTAGSILPRPWPRCLESSGPVVGEGPQGAQPPGSRPARGR